jgi:hypothetical protein
MTTTNTATETTMMINGDELSVALTLVREAAGIRTFAIGISHPEGGEASFEVVEFRGFTLGGSQGEGCPSEVSEAVRGIVRRMDAAWKGATVHEGMDARKAFARAMGA